MIRKISAVIGIIVLAGCTLMSENKIDYSNLKVSDGEMLKDKWKDLSRFPARYPLASAKSSRAGCVTVEYVITPDYNVENIVVTDFSNKDFSNNSKDVISKWKWSEMPKGLLTTAIKTQTRFDFCVESEGLSCADVIDSFSCVGTDTISSIGTKIRRRS